MFSIGMLRFSFGDKILVGEMDYVTNGYWSTAN